MFKLLTKIVLLVILTAVITSSVSAQFEEVYNDLKFGPYPFGFQSLEFFDHSRTFRTKYDYFGNIIEGERARPVQVLLWYPSLKQADDYEIIYSDLIFSFNDDERFLEFLGTLQNREVNTLNARFMNSGTTMTLLNVNFSARQNVSPAKGQFPLIIYHQDFNNGIPENAILCEYLASNGFVVAMTHNFGTNRLNLSQATEDLESILRDKEFALGKLHEIDFIDNERCALLGFGGGGVSAIMQAMRSTDIEATATINPGYLNTMYVEAVKNHFDYGLDKLRSPLMTIYDSSIPFNNMVIFDEIKYCEQFHFTLNDIPNKALSLYDYYQNSVNDSNFVAGPTAYSVIAPTLLTFFNKTIGIDSTALSAIVERTDKSEASINYRKSLPIPPNSEQFVQIIRQKSATDAKQIAEQFNLLTSTPPILSEAIFQGIGYQLLNSGNLKDAIILFSMGAKAFPNSANSWDCLGEAYAGDGQLERAIEFYEKALAILPDDTTTNPTIKTSIQTNAPGIIENLKNQLNANENN